MILVVDAKVGIAKNCVDNVGATTVLGSSHRIPVRLLRADCCTTSGPLVAVFGSLDVAPGTSWVGYPPLFGVVRRSGGWTG
jgi:hypothetical protein